MDNFDGTPVLVGNSLKYAYDAIHPNIGLADRMQLHQGVKDGHVDSVGFNLFVNPVDDGIIGLRVHVSFSHTQFELARRRQKEPSLQFCHVQIVALANSRNATV